ncbi:MAG: hypothetical protein KGD63_11960 [Candidatus Lokiarchaeota archaeon]|nr:hypothetical protein [Candidatus Lokiarchaeota archaeon]
MNRVLLVFGYFILFIVLGPLFVQISRLFVEDQFLYEIIYRLGWGISFFSTIMPSFFIIKKEFSIVININYAKFLLILNFIPVVTLVFINTIRSPFFFATILFVVINGLYIIQFMIILVKKSVGKIKKKFKLFFIGSMVSLPSLFFAIIVAIEILPPIIHEIIYIFGIIELIVGFTIIYYSIIDFPPFYEFEWKNNLKKLFIINNKNKECYFFHNFENIKDSQIKEANQSTDNNFMNEIDNIIPGSIIGIEQIISTIIRSDNEKINIIKKKNSVFCVEQGDKLSDITYILIIKQELESINHFLKLIKNQFETIYGEILLNLENLKEDKYILFSNFASIIDNLQ